MNVLIETHQRLLRESKTPYIRASYQDFSMDQRLMGIVGGRGVGKTTFLIHYLRQHYKDSDQALYISADHLYFSENTLLGLVDQFYKTFDGRLLCIDEIHRYKNWNQELKNIYDSYPKISVLFSGSSSIDLIKGKYDLSRRALIYRMTGFSFREYLEATLSKKFPILTLDTLIKDKSAGKKIAEIPRLLGHFKRYLKQGFYPIFTELSTYDAYAQSLMNIIDKTIYEDISNFYALKTKNLDTFRKILYFFATSQPGGLNINKLSKSLKKDHTTISNYLDMLRESGLLRFLLPDKEGHALVRNAEKIYLHNPNLFYAVAYAIGKEADVGMARELFVISQLEDAGYKVFFIKAGDLKCEQYTFEVGGPSKGKRQIRNTKSAFIIRDDVLTTAPGIMPLYLFGFLR